MTKTKPKTNRTVVGDLAAALVRKHPKFPTHQLARMLAKKHPAVFTSHERARSAVRYVRGARGAAFRKSPSIIVEAVRTPEQSKAASDGNPFSFPESDCTEYLPFELPTGLRRIGILSDFHIPYHDVVALTAALKFLKSWGVDGLYYNGDILDFYQLSRWEKDPRARSFKSELDQGRKTLAIIAEQLKPKWTGYKLGNHEERFIPYLRNRAPEIADLDELDLTSILKLKNIGIEVIGEKRIAWAGSLPIIHGHEYNKGLTEPVNIARGYFLRAKGTVMVSHHHRTSEHTETDISEKMMTAWSIGCLCGLHPAYMPQNRWNHGFATVEIDGKHFETRNYRISDGKVL
jgi:hypothetical protein